MHNSISHGATEVNSRERRVIANAALGMKQSCIMAIFENQIQDCFAEPRNDAPYLFLLKI